LRDVLDDEGFLARMRLTTGQLRALAREIVTTATAEYPMVDGSPVLELLEGTQPGSPSGMLFESAA